MSGYVKYKNDNKFKELCKPLSYEGGRELIERLIHLFELRNRVELADLIGVTPATLSTWTTRQTTPHELLIRIHLLTGWPMEYLCFGTGERNAIEPVTVEDFSNTIDKPTLTYNRGVLQVYTIKNGGLEPYEKFEATSNIIEHFKVKGNNGDIVLKDGDKLLFIDSQETTISHGKYLFTVNNIHQLGELRLMPDGKVHLSEHGVRYPVDTSAMKIIGKVVSILQSV